MTVSTDKKLLLIEDNAGDARLVELMLLESEIHRFEFYSANSLGDAEPLLGRHSFDIVLVDLSLPDSHGIETVIQTCKIAKNLPVVVMTGTDSEELALKIVQAGAQDYLVKGAVDSHLLIRTIHHAIERNHLLQQLEYARQRQEILANHDVLTNLPNRALFYDRLSHDIALAQRQSQILGILFIDLDRFKMINDSLGHSAGDKLLQTVAKRLTICLRQSDTVARFGGDEFVCIINNLTQTEDAGLVAQKIIDTVSEPLTLAGHTLSISPSIGISVFPNDANTPETLIKNADAAMYNAKEQGRSGYRYFSSAIHAQSVRQFKMECDLRSALKRNEFILHYQPIVDTISHEILSAEALVRWQHPEQGMIAPLDFIPLAEATGLIAPLGEQVLTMACQQNRAWQESGLPPIRISVNVSAYQLERTDLVKTINQVLQKTSLEPQWLGLEITEEFMLRDKDASIETLNRLRDLGLHISLDDFGTGYSSLSYLRHFPIDTLKIDQSFIREMITNKADAAITRAIIAMAHGLSLTTIAEGVETLEHVEFLQSELCSYLQGYHFSRPLPAKEFEQFLKNEKTSCVESIISELQTV